MTRDDDRMTTMPRRDDGWRPWAPTAVTAAVTAAALLALVGCDEDEACDPGCATGESCVEARCVPVGMVTDAGGTGSDGGGTGGEDAGGSGDMGGPGGPDAAVDAGGGDMGDPVSCEPGAAWTPQTPTFQDASQGWGLVDINAEGARISTGDFDGDGFADLAVRRVAFHTDTADSRAVWLLRNKGDGGFEDVTRSSNLIGPEGVTGRPAELVVFGDVDNDGDLDAFTGHGVPGAAGNMQVTLNRGDGTFGPAPLVSNDLVSLAQPESRGGVSFLDADRDGLLDLWIGGASSPGDGPLQDELYLGEGNGTFTLHTAAAGLTTQPWRDINQLNQALAHTNSWGVLSCDLNNDNVPDLMSSSYGRAPNHLWQGSLQGDQLQFTNRSVASTFAFDANQDWTTNQSARCFCKLNPQADGCAGVPAPDLIRCDTAADHFRWSARTHDQDRQPFRLGGNSGTAICADFDNDGFLDVLQAELRHFDVGSNSDRTQILRNTGAADIMLERIDPATNGLEEVHQNPGWDEGYITVASLDFDNDGRLDVIIGSTDYPGTRALLFHQKDDGTFEPVPLGVGIDHTSAHGIAVADFDRDGDLDLVMGHSANRCSSGNHCYPAGQRHARIFENLVGQANNWVQLELVGGPDTNRAAIGAQVLVQAGELTQRSEVDGGHGHYGMQQDLVQHFGLGHNCTAQVTVRWPDAAGTTQSFELVAGKRYRVVQGEAPVAVE